MNSFGDVPLILDQGRMERGIVAVGRQDVEQNNLIPTDDSVKIIGASSDHLIVDLTKTHYGVGNILSFKADYPGVLRLMTSPYVKKHLVKK
jgi:predicted amino acid racemase